MNVIETPIKGLLVLEPKLFRDGRGYFYESFREEELCSEGGPLSGVHFVQENQSLSQYGVVRGLHFQKGVHSQAKLVRAVVGKVYDVAVDLREGSPTFGRHFGVELSSENNLQLFIPRGFAHGFSVLSPEAVFIYKCDNYYCRESEGGLAWDDPSLGIDWKVPEEDILLSDKDRDRTPLKDADLGDRVPYTE